jgi:hypothetical protein
VVIWTVAPVRFALSTSVTIRFGSMATTEIGAFSTNGVIPALVVTTGALLTAPMVTVFVAALLFEVPSVTWKVTTRAVAVGLFADVSL